MTLARPHTGALERALETYPALQADCGVIAGRRYLRATTETVLWGRLPCENDAAVMNVRSGDIVTVDTVSHEGILEDQGRDPVAFFAGYGVPGEGVLDDAKAIASGVGHDGVLDGPHVVTGPIAVTGARPGDLLEIEILDLQLRSGYGIVSSRHGLGALPAEFPQAGGLHCTFCLVEPGDGGPLGHIALADERALRFPLRPFLGVMGVAVAGGERPNSVPPGAYGGNIDIRLLGVGSRLFIPVQVADAMFYAGDPHFAQGDGEVALTAFEAPLRATVRLTIRTQTEVTAPVLHGATDALLIAIGLDEDLNEAMRKCVRCALDLLEGGYGIDRPTGYAYLSAAADFAVSQVVDQVKGVHGVIQRAHLPPPRVQSGTTHA